MGVDPRKIINSPFGLTLARFVGKYTPYWLGDRIAYFAADRISRRKDWVLVRAVRCNQWVVHRQNLEQAELDRLVAENFRTIACSIFDLYHNIHNPTASIKIIEPDPVAIQLVQRPEFSSRGLIVAGIHMSNFDMAFQVGGLAGIKAIALTLPELDAGYRVQLEMRQKNGLNVIQTSVGTLKHAVDHLKAGGMVITGLDRPDENYKYHPRFFGVPANIPIHHVFLALKAHVPIMVAGVIKKTDGKYHFLFSEPIEMQPHPDRQQEIILNAENILHVAEDFVQRDPIQWSMTYPVWPQIMSGVP
ncbi:MAG: hypothetical protein A2136_09760 [Chloroflexi bacterium RBG_16_54_11]|nr:MAG: hypothetical protein A2136_09760 [Chloroflexi bacterium RBG_16_54_11]